MHTNSLKAYSEDEQHFTARERVIYDLLMKTMRFMTDREIMHELGFKDPNAVRPRITELIKDYWVREVGNTVDSESGKRVRRVRGLGIQERREMLTLIEQQKANQQMDLFKAA